MAYRALHTGINKWRLHRQRTQGYHNQHGTYNGGGQSFMPSAWYVAELDQEAEDDIAEVVRVIAAS